MQAAPQQRAGYCQNEQRSGQCIGEQYPCIGHPASFVKIGEGLPEIGFFLLNMRIRVTFPILRSNAQIGRNEHNAPVFRLLDLSATPGYGTGRLFLDAGFGVRQFVFRP